ncbi:MAG TPA: HEAT repeat domain-containing protein [Kofleriaceae bacterium]|nr:HEAT repeat domain-containing protein [Kofleriaceae bacterium]
MRALVCLLTLAATLTSLPAPRSALAQGDWDVKRDPFDRQVVARYKRILAQNPGDKDALGKLRGMYKRYRSVGLLISEYEKALAAKPGDFAILVVLGHLELGEGKQAEALGYYEKAAALRPADVGLAISLGDMYRQAGQVDKAKDAYDRALARAGDKKQKQQLLRSLAALALDKNDIAAAKAYFDKYIALDPADAQVRLDLADALSRFKRYDEAIATLRASESRLRADPARRVEVISRIGQVYEAAGKDDEAIREYRRAMTATQKGYYLRKELTERIIEIHRRKQDLNVLVGELEKEWKPGGRGYFEWDVLARLYEETGMQEKALEAYKKAVAAAPYELETQRRLIALYENSGREAEALKQYEAVIRVAPGEPRFQLELAERLWRRGDEKRAIALLHKVESRFGGDAGVQSALADLYTRWGKEDLALKSYERLVVIEPDELSHLVNLGDQHFQRGDKKHALAIWKRIAARKTAPGYAKLGEVYAEHDMLTEALDMYARALKLKPKDPELFKGRAAVYERQRRLPEAVADWEKALSLLPTGKAQRATRRDVRRQIVNLLKRAGGRALSDRVDRWERAFAARPPDVEAGYFLSEVHLRQGQYRSARTVLEKLLTLAADDLDAMDQLVKVYKSQHEYDRAIALLEKLAAASPGRERDYYNQIAEIKTILHRDDEAIEWARKAVAKSPKDPVAHMQMAERYKDMQKYDLAIAAYQKTIELDARNYEAYFALARLYRNKHDLALAGKLYREVLERSTDEETLHKAAREAVNLEELTGKLGELERTMAPLAFSLAHKGVYRVILVELYDRYVPTLVERWRRGNAAEKQAAQEELERLGAHGLKPLLEALSDERDPVQQRIAVSVLGYLGNKGAAAPLVRLARQAVPAGATKPRIGTLSPTIEIDMRVEAVVGAGRLGDPRTIPDLIQLGAHPEVAMREAAVFALGMTGDRRALSPLLTALDDRRDSVQTLACLGLARLAERKATATGQLAAVVRDSGRPDETRAACAFALGVSGERAAVAPLGDLLSDGQGEAQRLAAWSLGRIADRRALPVLLTAYFAKRDRVREAVAWALPRVAAGQSGGGEAVRFIDYPMKNGKLDVRAAVALLGQTEGDPALAPGLLIGHDKDLARGLREAMERHRDAVLRVLEDLDARPGGIALGPLTAALDQAPARERDQVAAALDRIGQQILPQVEKLAGHRDPLVRRRALSVAGKIAAPEVKPLLERALDDDEISVREGAMRACAYFVARRGAKASDLVRRVVDRLAAPGWQERVAAARALGDFGSFADRDALARAALSDDKAFVREAAVASLGRLDPRQAESVLLQALDSAREKVPEVRQAAAQALAPLAASGDERARSALARSAESDPSAAVRAAARQPRGSEKK